MASFQLRKLGRLLGRAAADLARIQVDEVQGRILQKRKNKGSQKERVHIPGPSTSAEKRYLWRSKHKARRWWWLEGVQGRSGNLLSVLGWGLCVPQWGG